MASAREKWAASLPAQQLGSPAKAAGGRHSSPMHVLLGLLRQTPGSRKNLKPLCHFCASNVCWWRLRRCTHLPLEHALLPRMKVREGRLLSTELLCA